ncbi:siderophore-interacting protein [Rhodophyticola sp. CCM32]|uniref:siderophore-interacting protein n=1 Tax=Rhodophyticola sp. CCM32 TaxID=2916397 RepID=UPI00107F6A1E|nr:siderophore-interacting protein [Rhodophyticola sp. CCM32]QBX99989.1 siderophore-interacting protein [Rhodophyticola sp. CCM32]
MTVPKPPARLARLLIVSHTARITPNMIRVTFQGADLADIPAESAGAHCKLFFAEAGQSRESFRQQLADGPRPVARTYTIRHARPDMGEIDIDFVAHGSEGPASTWALEAGPGSFCGMGGHGQPKLTRFDADWYLLAADMTALPMASAALEALPRKARGIAVFEITSEADIQTLAAPPGMTVQWLIQPDPHKASTAQLDFLTAMTWPEGRVRVCIAGEGSAIAALRSYVRVERAVPRGDVYISGYWKIGLREDDHQKIKRQEAETAERALS